jgi:NADH:ubiquinone oxidoreductase subunit
MNFLHKLGSMLGHNSNRTLVGKDRNGNQFYTIPHSRAGEPAKRLVEYKDGPEPTSLHPLWRHWLAYARETSPTDKDVYMWEMEQARLRRRLKEIDAASNKMRSEEDAERERGSSEMQNMLARLSSQLSRDQSSGQAPTTQSNTENVEFTMPPQPAGPAPGSNLAFQDGVPIIPKDTQPYSPDPSRLQSILNKKRNETSPSTPSDRSSTSQHSTWTPTTPSKGIDADSL